ncbi:MAG: hypothetical protein M0P69_19625, partial [Bacteroidales bacterium]|nr:hypothetical protein [Bacteroidales bacterium]
RQPGKVKDAIRSKQMPPKEISKITMGPTAPRTSKGYRPPKPTPKKEHHARGVEYIDVKHHEKQYLSRFSWVVSYRYRRSDELNYITITSSRDLYAYEVLAEAVTVLEANDTGNYNVRQIAWTSVAIDYAIYNPDGV